MDHTREEKIAIKALAATKDTSLSIRHEAIAAHRQFIARCTRPRGGRLPYGNPYFEFMREVDTPIPDLLLRHRRRAEVLAATL